MENIKITRIFHGEFYKMQPNAKYNNSNINIQNAIKKIGKLEF